MKFTESQLKNYSAPLSQSEEGVVLAKRGKYTLRQLLQKSLLSKHSNLELILNSTKIN